MQTRPSARPFPGSMKQENLGLNIVIADIESVLATIPPLQISATKTTTYSLDTLTPTETWTISFMFEILNFKFAVDFSDSGTTFYLIPMPNFTLTDIVNDLSTAVGNIGGLDSNQMYAMNQISIIIHRSNFS